MKEKIGEVFSIAKENPAIPGCTISKEIYGGENAITYFSLAPDTDISAEMYPYRRLLIVMEGSLQVYGPDGYLQTLEVGDGIVTWVNTPIGVRTAEGSVFIEGSLRKESVMNQAIKAGEVFKLEDLIPYAEDRIVNMDVLQNDKMKFVIMSFDEGTGLAEHAAPGEAIVFALDGKAVIGYEGEEHSIKAGESMHFAKGGLHSIKATEKFKMALLLTLA